MAGINTLSDEELKRFVTIWTASQTIAEFCNRFNISQRDASNISTSLRRAGVSLKRMPTPRQIGQKKKRLTPSLINELNLAIRIEESAQEGERLRKRTSER